MRIKSIKRRQLIELQYFSLLVPALIVFTVGLIVPMLIGLYFSMTDWTGLTTEKNFIWFENYKTLFQDKQLGDAAWFTARFAVFNTIIQNVLALLFAMAVDSGIKGKKFIRTAIFSPVLLSPILCGFIWSRMYADVLPSINKLLGTDINFMLFGSMKTVLTGLLAANNWQWIGYWMLIYLAALQSVPKELYEAAVMDGAGPMRKFRHITLPMVAPAATICIIGITTGSLKVYDLILTATNGGPGHASESVILYIYKTAFSSHNSGYASSISIFFLLVLFLIAAIQLVILRKREVQM